MRGTDEWICLTVLYNEVTNRNGKSTEAISRKEAFNRLFYWDGKNNLKTKPCSDTSQKNFIKIFVETAEVELASSESTNKPWFLHRLWGSSPVEFSGMG